eukprot:COSAG02_NODE_3537_length_6594_cov_4.011239_2_plen_75_part_00
MSAAENEKCNAKLSTRLSKIPAVESVDAIFRDISDLRNGQNHTRDCDSSDTCYRNVLLLLIHVRFIVSGLAAVT